jgi:hypothetical protein
MKFSNWIASYLLKDTLCRLKENKLATLARLFVSGLLCFGSLLVLMAVAMESQVVQRKIESIGAHSILLRSSEVCQHTHAPGMLPFEDGSVEDALLLKRHMHTASTDEHKNIPIFTYSTQNPPAWTSANQSETGIFLFTRDNRPQLCQALGEEFLATSLTDPRLQPLEHNHALLLPEGLYPWIDNTSFHSVALIHAESTEHFHHILRKLNQYYDTSAAPRPHIESSQSLILLLDELESHRQLWRILLMVFTGGTLALVFGAIAIFMYRENLYVFSLIKSFGLGKSWIFSTVVLENTFVALIGAAIGISAAILSAPQILSVFGFQETLQLPKTDLSFLLLCVLASGILASLPILKTLRQPVGEVLA